MKTLFLVPLVCITLAAQKPAASEAEEHDLSTAVGEAGNSPLEFMRAIEKHLAKYPNTARRADLERAMVKAAMDAKDDKRIVLYGERVLVRESDDIQILDRVTRALLAGDAKDTSERALKYARRYVELVAAMRSQPATGRPGGGQWREEIDRGMARALALEARATGNLGRPDEAVKLAQQSYDSYPNAESAREIGRWLARSGKEEEAVARIADAFTISDARNTDTDRAKDRARMGELYRKLKGSEKGLGDVILEAWDRTNAQVAARRLRLRESDPNSSATSLMEFTLSGPGREETATRLPPRQDRDLRFLGHLVRTLPRPAPALRRGEAPFPELA